MLHITFIFLMLASVLVVWQLAIGAFLIVLEVLGRIWPRASSATVVTVSLAIVGVGLSALVVLA